MLGLNVANDLPGRYTSNRSLALPRAEILDGQSGDIQSLIAGTLCDKAQNGLVSAGVDKADARNVMDIIRERTRTGMNGAAWQRAWINCNGQDFQGLTDAYLTHQNDGHPVHTWRV